MTNMNDVGEGAAGAPEPDSVDRVDVDDSEEDVDDSQQPPAPYVHDTSHAHTAIVFLEGAAQNATRLHDLGTETAVAVTAAGLDTGAPLYQTLQSFTWYRLKVDRGEGGGPGAALEPLRDEGKDWYWPQPIRSVGDDVKRLWSDIAAAASDVVIGARAHDLCFAGQVGNGGLHAIAAGEAYLQWPTTNVEPLDVALGLVRAWTLGRAVGDGKLEQQAYDVIAVYARGQLDNGGNPGTVLPLLETLTTPPRAAAGVPPAALEAMVADARALYPASFLQVRLAAMMRRTAQDEAAAALRTESRRRHTSTRRTEHHSPPSACTTSKRPRPRQSASTSRISKPPP